MKALTLTQPWATLVALGRKTVETRGWNTHHRGPLAIHAAKTLGGMTSAQFVRLCSREPFRSALGTDGDLLARGVVLATCRFVDVVETERISEPGRPDWEGRLRWADGSWTLGWQELAFGDYSKRRYAFVLAGVRPLREPVPARGRLGLWDWEPS